MSNQYYIEKYKDFDKILKGYYSVKDNNGNLIELTDIVSPLKIDSRQICAVPEDQGNTPHCAGFSCSNYWETIYWKKTGRLVSFDPDQIYAKAKQWEDSQNINAEGTYLESTQNACARLCGVKDQINLKFLYNDGTNRTILAMKHLIHRYDVCQIGCNITTAWYEANPQNYVIQHRGRVLGGHAILAVGYSPEGLYIQNSWGKEWGAKSFAILSWDAFLKEFMYACYIENIDELKFERI